MQLNQPIPPTDAGGDSPYDFILNGNQKPKKSLVPIPLPGGNSRKQRLLVIIGGGVALLVVFAVVLMLIFSAGGNSTKTLLSLAQEQTEIVRISDSGRTVARSATAQNYAATVNASLTTSQLKTVAYLKSKHQKVDNKKLKLGHSSKTDASLESAQAAGRYDEELVKTLNGQLANYQTQLKQAYSQTNSTTEKNLLQQLSEQVQILAKNQPTSS